MTDCISGPKTRKMGEREGGEFCDGILLFRLIKRILSLGKGLQQITCVMYKNKELIKIKQQTKKIEQNPPRKKQGGKGEQNISKHQQQEQTNKLLIGLRANN